MEGSAGGQQSADFVGCAAQPTETAHFAVSLQGRGMEVRAATTTSLPWRGAVSGGKGLSLFSPQFVQAIG